MIFDLVGSTALSARLASEDMRTVIDAYHAACARRFRDHQSNAEVLAGTNCRWMLCHLVLSWTNEALKLAPPLPGRPWRGF
jgi:hypothetical protein